MNKAICKRVNELRSLLLLGTITERFYQQELNRLLEMVQDEDTRTFILQNKDLEI